MTTDPTGPMRHEAPMLATLRHSVAARKAELDRIRPPAGALSNFERSQDLELTFTSNAIEGNTLTAAETTLVVDQGITVSGKPLRDHLEAIDHFEAIRYVRELARHPTPITQMDVRALHRLVVLRSSPDIAGSYAGQGRYVLTDAGRHAFPAPAAVPALMDDFVSWLRGATPALDAAFAAHLRLVTIHPFDDGNGRTARLLMNLFLIRDGFPPVAIRPVDRPAYIAGLQQAQAEPSRTEAFERLMFERLLDALDEQIQAVRDLAPRRPNEN